MRKPLTAQQRLLNSLKPPGRLKIKGHKLTLSRSGVGGSYWKGCCECGAWRSTNWTEKARDIRDDHEGHLLKVSRVQIHG